MGGAVLHPSPQRKQGTWERCLDPAGAVVTTGTTGASPANYVPRFQTQGRLITI